MIIIIRLRELLSDDVKNLARMNASASASAKSILEGKKEEKYSLLILDIIPPPLGEDKATFNSSSFEIVICKTYETELETVLLVIRRHTSNY
jgi:hypothetical protein